MNYAQARQDHEYLWQTYGPADDMTGSYVDQNDLHRLLCNPTKATARDCYSDQIGYWFRVGPDIRDPRATDGWKDDPEVKAIASRHCAEEDRKALIGRWGR